MSESINYKINLNDNLFVDAINHILLTYQVDEIIETGTFNGLGSTSIFAKTGKKVISIESCLNHYQQAKENLKNYPNVFLNYGSSLDIKEMEEFIDNDDFYESDLIKNKNLFIDGDKNFYKNEINGFGIENPPKENILIDFIDNYSNQLIFLDSAGGVGYMEYQKVMSLSYKKLQKKVLLLDDIRHIKHYRSILDIKQKGYNLVISENQRFAYCTF
jgi:hypothetical protein